MELSILKLNDPAPARSVGERRRRIRHKLHSPVYASFNGQSAGMVLELSELLDLSEEGFAVHTSQPLKVNQSLTLSLDLPETRSYVHGAGQVVWSDGSGRGGIRFSGLTEQSQRILKEWLFVNLLVACQKSVARTAPVSLPVETIPPALGPILQAAAAPVLDLSGILSAVEAVRREVCAADFDAALHLITERALSLTGAGGAALAFLTDDKMICRASSGDPALPLGTAVDVKQGITGECIRSGRMVACEDVDTDARVDREICSLLGIGSILASPIVADFGVVGLIEVFSPHARAFTQVHETALDRLAQLVPKTQLATLPAEEGSSEVTEPLPAEPAPALRTTREAVWEAEREAQEPLKGVPVRLAHIVLLVSTAAMVALVSGYLLAPKIEKIWLSKQGPVGSQVSAQIGVAQAATTPVTRPRTFDEMRKLAEQGDAEAQYDLGSRYHNGEGVLHDDVQAAKWFERAAEQGHIGSQRALGSSYWAGRGVPRDLSKAYFWSTVAANQGDEISASQMQGLVLQMTRAQVAAAQSQADDWKRQHRAAK
jgi:putative methionine-R-sulfoxide reductase with GAF domain